MAEWSGTFGDDLFENQNELFDPEVDLDGNGVVDTMVLRAEEHGSTAGGLSVLSDLDGDGHIDRVTEFDADGDFTAWVLLSDPSDPHWKPVERGSL